MDEKIFRQHCVVELRKAEILKEIVTGRHTIRRGVRMG